jgi:hypothetical protein
MRLQLLLGGRGDAIWCARARRAASSAPSSTPRPDLLDWLQTKRLRRRLAHPAAAPCHRRPAAKAAPGSTARAATVAQLRRVGRPTAGRHPRPARLAEPDPPGQPSAALLDEPRRRGRRRRWPRPSRRWRATARRPRSAQAQRRAGLAGARARTPVVAARRDSTNSPPGVGEWPELNQREHQRLSHAQALIDAAQAAASTPSARATTDRAARWLRTGPSHCASGQASTPRCSPSSPL